MQTFTQCKQYSHFVNVKYFLFVFLVKCNELLEKDVLACSQVALSMWKAKYLSDTEEEPGLSSKDEATGMDQHQAIARRLPSAHRGEVPL